MSGSRPENFAHVTARHDLWRRRLAPLARRALPMTLAALLAWPALAAATPWMFDQDGDGLDDRLETVASQGLLAAYENLDPQGRLRFEVGLVGNVLQYGGYVRFDATPTAGDSAGVALLGAQVISRLSAAPYLHVRATWPTLLLIAQRPGVVRVEAVTLAYAMNWRERQLLGVTDGALSPHPALAARAALDGAGVNVALLDTGINDAPVGGYPGHVDLAGRVLGGADFSGPGPAGYTAWNASVNPAQATPGLASYHATHLAGTIAGGPATRAFGGLASAARLVDVKVLGDDGTGSGLAEGLEWCWRNRQRAWGGGATPGIQLVNLSLSGTDPSNGDDCVCALVNALADAGVLVVASAGNDGRCGHLPAPGAADGAITVGAYDPLDATDPDDDALAAFSNEGPRAADPDGGQLDELKPDLVAPGVGVVSAWGAPLGTGHGYRAADGTSMATACVTGALALLRQAQPALTPAAARDLLHRTARHRMNDARACSAGPDPLQVDARYHAGWGYGELDALAAWLELAAPTATQFLDLRGRWVNSTVELAWTTQREANLTGFLVQRAPDQGGAPGLFVTLPGGPVPAVGFATLAGGNRTRYGFTDVGPGGGCAWYRLVTTGGAATEVSPAVEVAAEAPLGEARVTLHHNTPATDLALTLGSGLPNAPDYQRALPLPFGAPVLDATVGGPNDEEIQFTLALPLLAAQGAGGLLPPSPERVWWLSAAEAGDPARAGRIDDFRLRVGATDYLPSAPLPAPTLEGGTIHAWIPDLPTSRVEEPTPPRAPRLALAQNPARGGIAFRLDTPAATRATLLLLDVGGRVIRRQGPLELAAGARDFTWPARDEAGRPLAAGRYYLVLTTDAGRQLTPLTLLR